MTLSGITYHCVAGETWDSVALNAYGHEKYAAELLCANPALCLKTMFTGGEILELPQIFIADERGDEDVSGAMPDIAPWKRGGE